MTPAGRRRHRVAVRRHGAAGQGSLGTPKDVWPADPTDIVMASRDDVSDGEKIAAGAKLSVRRTRFVVLRTARAGSVTVKDRLVSSGVTFEIIGVKLISNDREIEWTAEARVDA